MFADMMAGVGEVHGDEEEAEAEERSEAGVVRGLATGEGMSSGGKDTASAVGGGPSVDDSGDGKRKGSSGAGEDGGQDGRSQDGKLTKEEERAEGAVQGRVFKVCAWGSSWW